MIKSFWLELVDEVSDFFEDYAEHLFHKKPTHKPKLKKTVINGIAVEVRPAYLFAERIDNILKVIFGISICASAIGATFFGFIKLSDLLEYLINSWWGRVLMMIIGLSYLITAFWKLLHLDNKTKGE